jgi:pyruvate dehydrogenase (quinone)
VRAVPRQRGAALRHVMPPFVPVEPAVAMALYTTRAVLHGRGGDVWEMVKENFL